MEQRLEQAPPGTQFSSAPSHGSILGVLRACEEQTAKFDWFQLLHVVGAKMNVAPGIYLRPMEKSVLSGLALLFAYIQSLPEDRQILVNTDCGLGILVVWAHHVLGFSVLVQMRENPNEDILFGNSPAAIVIGPEKIYTTATEPCVTLIEASSGDCLFSIVREPEEDYPITSTIKRPAKGIGMYLLTNDWDNRVDFRHTDDGRRACMDEMMLISAAFALRLSKYLYKGIYGYSQSSGVVSVVSDEGDVDSAVNVPAQDEGPFSSSVPEPISKNLVPLEVREHGIIQAAELLFGSKKISGKAVASYLDAHQNIGRHDLPRPATFTAACDQYGHDPLMWDDVFVPTIVQLSLVALVFAQVTDLDEAGRLLINTKLTCISDEEIYKEIMRWRGYAPIIVDDSTWFKTVTALLAGTTSGWDDLYGLESLSLVSDRGWSVYLSNFGNPDPGYVGKRSIYRLNIGLLIYMNSTGNFRRQRRGPQ